MIDIRRVRCFAGALLAFVLTALAGCGGGAEDDPPPGDPVPRQGSIRVVNAIPDSPNVAALLSGSVLATLDFGQASPLTKQLVGIYDLVLVYVDPDGDAHEIGRADDIELTQEDEVNFLLLGTWAQPQLVRIDNVEIDFGVRSREDADVQVVHGATGTSAVDVYLTELGADLATATPLVSAAFGDVGPLQVVAAGTNYQLRVTTAGTTTVLFDSGKFEIAKFTRMIFLLRDYFGPGAHSVRMTPIDIEAAKTFPSEPLEVALRFGSFVSDTPALDVYFVDTASPPVFANVAFPTFTPFQPATRGTRNVKLTAAGTTSPFVVESTTTLVAGNYMTILAGGRDEGNTAAIATVIDDVRPIATEARLRIDHTATEAGTIDVYIRSPGEPIAGVAPTFSGFQLNGRRVAPLLPGSYDVTVTRAGSQVSLVGPEPLTVELGGLYTLVLTDAAGGGAPVALRRFDDLAP